jgi:hypothetical protein
VNVSFYRVLGLGKFGDKNKAFSWLFGETPTIYIAIYIDLPCEELLLFSLSQRTTI